MLIKALEMGIWFPTAPLLENKEGCPFLSAFEKKGGENLFRGIFMRVSRDMQKCPGNRYLSLHRGPVGEHGGGSFAWRFLEKRKTISGFLS
jgi:hypothetical protein